MKHHVLVIDDESAVREVIGLQLKDTRYEVLTAENGEQAIEVLNANPLSIDVIICDVRMPKIGGVEAVAYFRKEFPSTPVVVLTGFPDVNLAVDFMKQGVIEFLVKPVEKAQLVEVVEKAAEKRTLFTASN